MFSLDLINVGFADLICINLASLFEVNKER